jgi:hypothetical protein
MNLGKTVNALKNKVLETVQTTTKPKFISEDENFNLLYEKYTRLGSFENQLNNLVKGKPLSEFNSLNIASKESLSSIQRSTQANKELSVFLQMNIDGQLRDCFDINSITEKVSPKIMRNLIIISSAIFKTASLLLTLTILCPIRNNNS